MNPAAGHKQGDSYTLSVCNVSPLDFPIIHVLSVQMTDGLQMKYPLLDFLGTSLIPVLSSDIATGTACNIHG